METVDDPSIPLLTDRIFLPAVDLDTALPASLVSAAAQKVRAVRADPRAAALAEAAQPAAADMGGEVLAGVADEPPTVIEAQPAETGPAEQTAAEAAVEAELDRDLVTASNADFDALLSAEPPIDAGEVTTQGDPAVMAGEAPPAALPTDEAPSAAAAEMTVTSAAVAPPLDQAAIEAQAEALRAAVLQRVAQRLPQQVTATVRDLLLPAIDQAMAKLGEEAEVALRITLQELVEQALREELEQQATRPRS